MGAKQSKKNSESTTSLNPNERRKLTIFLESRGSQYQFNHQDMQNLWKDFLVPDLLKSYSDFLMKQDVSKRNYIGVDQFVLIYSALVRGDSDDKATTLAGILGSHETSEGQAIYFTDLCKYLADLLESYFLGLKHKNDTNYKSWTHSKHPERIVMEQIISGVCSELPRKNNEVSIREMERWLHYTGMISVLHSYVLGSLYNLDPEANESTIPEALFPSSKTPTFLDLSQVIYLNCFLPSENKTLWRLLFSTVSHGESFSKMVGCIVNQGPVLIFIESDDHSIFGGFATENLTLGPRWSGTGDCFLFELKPTTEVYPSTGYNDHYVYFNMNQSSLPNGLGMGGQFSFWGLWIDSHFGTGECSESCTTYKNYKMLASRKKFHIRRLEVWGVGDPPLTAEERGERASPSMTQKSILDKDPTTSHFLTMVGHKTYSDGIRKVSQQYNNN